MKSLSYKGKTYFLNSAKPTDKEYEVFFGNARKRASEEVDYFLAQRKYNVFHPQHLREGYDDLSFILGFFSDIEQPTEAKVRRAMLLQISDNHGEGPENKYSLKAGGGSASDSIFSSSYSILIADPKTGYDKSVVLLKKYSTKFEDVLITAEEINDLFEMVATPTQKTARDDEFARDILGLLIAAMCSGKVHYSKGKAKPLTPALLSELIAKNKPQVSIQSFEHAFDFFERRFADNLKVEIVEDDPKVNRTQQYQQANRVKIMHLNKLEVLFGLSEANNQPLMVPAGIQAELFAA